MDILTHTISGMAIGSCLAIYSNGTWREKAGIILLSGVGALLPDIDAISLWSGFDATIGNRLHLPHPGKDIYSGKLWYSHHGFMHSLFAAAVLTLLLGLFIRIGEKGENLNKTIHPFKKYSLLVSGFFLGYLVHLIEDMVTPGGSWGGVRFFFPSQIYIGGTGNIWWWNNYDIFLIVLSVFLINLIILMIASLCKFKWKKAGVIPLFIGLAFVGVQINTRNFNFNRKPYQECETQSKNIQKEIMGKQLYQTMERFDNRLKIYF